MSIARINDIGDDPVAYQALAYLYDLGLIEPLNDDDLGDLDEEPGEESESQGVIIDASRDRFEMAVDTYYLINHGDGLPRMTYEQFVWLINSLWIGDIT